MRCKYPDCDERTAWNSEYCSEEHEQLDLSGGRALSRPLPRPVEPRPSGTREYKVITQRDKWFGGKFDPEMLTVLLNEHARDGWRVVSVATADVSTFFGTFWSGRGARQELVVVLEKVWP